jgi:hypothetical protein
MNKTIVNKMMNRPPRRRRRYEAGGDDQLFPATGSRLPSPQKWRQRLALHRTAQDVSRVPGLGFEMPHDTRIHFSQQNHAFLSFFDFSGTSGLLAHDLYRL